ncbi:MAG: hypothetical protein KAI79_15105 [Bacteroidales bacterium]|nr:hypothetical protein [Bacteroidales bacterium]
MPWLWCTITKKTSIVTWTFLFAVIVVVLFSFGSEQPKTSGASNYSASNSIPSYSKPRPRLEVVSWKCSTEYGYIYVLGEVKNISSQSIKNVMAVGSFRTKNDIFVKSEDALIDYNPILPGQISPFKAGGTRNPEIKNCSLSFKEMFGGELSYITAKDKKTENRKKSKKLKNYY